MYLKELIKKTFSKEKTTIILYLINVIVLMTFYYLLDEEKFTIYPLILTIFFLCTYLVYKALIYKKLYLALELQKQSPIYDSDQVYEYNDILDYLRQIHQTYMSQIYEMNLKYNEKNKLLSQWIHNMKTSVAVIELVAEKGLLNNTENNELFSDIIEEKNKLQENLEGALNMFRLEEFSKDYVPERVLLKELVKNAVNAKKRDFIYSNVFPKVQIDEDIYIYTDQKWGRYVIEQVLSNSIKYSEKLNSSVYISVIKSNDKVSLVIEDEGIGIRKEDINRVFDLFFTGKIGRKNRESTGIGLYMCKLICEKLNNKIEIESVEGKGTKVIISYINAS